MKDERKNIKEPYQPDNTPNPPQIIDPSKRNENNEREAPVENKQRDANQQSQEQKAQPKTKEEKPKRLGESQPDINDETTT